MVQSGALALTNGSSMYAVCAALSYDQYILKEGSVQSAGPLGVIGRNGWFVQDELLETWPALSGYRGMRDPDVKQMLNFTFLAFGDSASSSWGPQQEVPLAREVLNVRRVPTN